MKRTKTIIALCLMLLTTQSFAQKKVKLENERDSASYALGIILASQLKQTNVKSLNYDAMVKGMVDHFEAIDSPKFDMESAKIIYSDFLQSIAQKESDANKAIGEKFLAENAKKKGVVTTASGLQYKVITEGDGPMPAAEDRVVTHYTGKFIDGKVFDSSVERGEPVTFGVGQVIPGWTEALQLMKVGSKWEVFVPSDLGYGPRGNRGIPGNSVLIFEVELIAIEGDTAPGQ